MKLRHTSVAAFRIASASLLLALPFATVSAACDHPHKRNDWRSPAQPIACTTDGDCRGGTCAIEVGASHGTCAPPAALPSLPGAGADGGTATPGPVPNVQPSPNDVQL